MSNKTIDFTKPIEMLNGNPAECVGNSNVFIDCVEYFLVLETFKNGDRRTTVVDTYGRDIYTVRQVLRNKKTTYVRYLNLYTYGFDAVNFPTMEAAVSNANSDSDYIKTVRVAETI